MTDPHSVGETALEPPAGHDLVHVALLRGESVEPGGEPLQLVATHALGLLPQRDRVTADDGARAMTLEGTGVTEHVRRGDGECEMEARRDLTWDEFMSRADACTGEHERIFALGDATNLPISKSGSTAHFEAPVIASRAWPFSKSTRDSSIRTSTSTIGANALATARASAVPAARPSLSAVSAVTGSDRKSVV